jgi:hypothetical protein
MTWTWMRYRKKKISHGQRIQNGFTLSPSRMFQGRKSEVQKLFCGVAFLMGSLIQCFRGCLYKFSEWVPWAMLETGENRKTASFSDRHSLSSGSAKPFSTGTLYRLHFVSHLCLKLLFFNWGPGVLPREALSHHLLWGSASHWSGLSSMATSFIRLCWCSWDH